MKLTIIGSMPASDFSASFTMKKEHGYSKILPVKCSPNKNLLD